MIPRPICLIILDGFGCRKETKDNAIAQAKTPVWDHLMKTCPHTMLSASNTDVGLPEGQMGNSEVGHLTMGAGRVMPQDLLRITQSITTQDFFKNQNLINAFNSAKKNNKTVHILGLLSPGGVHSHEYHIFSLIKFAKDMQVPSLLVHAFLDGRDTPPKSAFSSLASLQELCNENIAIGSISGRFFAMDRDKRYERTQLVYDLLTENKAKYHSENALTALQQAYDRHESDEFVTPTLIGTHPPIQDNDIIIFMNFRSDRARQLTDAFISPEFNGFKRHVIPKISEFLSLTEFSSSLKTTVLFPPIPLNNMLGEYLALQHKTQLRIAETEKYAHVTFFFNGGVETPFVGEERILIPSAKVNTYDLCPEMSAKEITQALIDVIKQDRFDVIICNFANPDMVGHTGNFNATIKAIETIDECLGKITNALKEKKGEAIITADHGNAELMFDENTKQAHTAHTRSLVPFIFIGRSAKITHHNGTLSDIAPTLLTLMNLPIPSEMTGKPLLSL